MDVDLWVITSLTKDSKVSFQAQGLFGINIRAV